MYNYYIYDDGRVWSEVSGKFLTPVEDKDGYLKIRLISVDGKRHRYSIHRLVLENYSPRDDMATLQVNHKDGDKRNNSLENLEWMSCVENIHHAMKNGLRAKVNGSAKLTWEQVSEIREKSSRGVSNVESAEEYGLHPDTIGRIKNNQTWISANVQRPVV